VRCAGTQPVEHHVDLPRNQVLQRGACAAVRNVRDEGLGLQLEQFAGEVMGCSVACRTVVQPPRVFAQVRHQLLQAGGLDLLWIDDDHLGDARHQPDGNEVGSML
jgi:hypothetical protein